MHARGAGHSGGPKTLRGPVQAAPDGLREPLLVGRVGGPGERVVETCEGRLPPREGAAQPHEKVARAGGRRAGIALFRESRGEPLGDWAPPRILPEAAEKKHARDVLRPARRKGAAKVPRRDPERAARALSRCGARQARESSDPAQRDAKVVKHLARWRA